MRRLGAIAIEVLREVQSATEHETLVRLMAMTLPNKLNLDDDRAVILALVALRFDGTTIVECVDEAVALARKTREGRL